MALFDNTSMTTYGNSQQVWGLGGGMINTQDLIDMEMQVMQMRNYPYQQRMQQIQQELKGWNAFESTLGKIVTAADDLRDVNLEDKSVDLSEEGFADISATGSAIDGKYSLSIQQVAQEQKILGSTVSDSSSPLGYDGTFQINGTDLKVTSDMSLSMIAQEINKGEYGANAVVVSDTLVLSSDKTGVTNEMTFTDSAGGSRVVSSDESKLTASITGSPDPGNNTYNLEISQLASSQIVESNNVTDTTASLGYSGSFTMNGETFTLAESDGLTDIVDKINASSTLGVEASIESGKLSLKGDIGAGNGFSLTDTTTSTTKSNSVFNEIGLIDGGGAFSNQTSSAQDASYTIDGVAYNSSDNTSNDINGVEVELKEVTTGPVSVTVDSGNVGILENLGILNPDGSIKNETQQAKDAQYTIEGISGSSASNVIKDAIEGVSIELTEETTSDIEFDINQNNDLIKEKLQTFVDNYNNVIMNINQMTSEGSNLQGESLINRAKRTLANVLMSDTSSTLHLFDIGVSIDGEMKDGTITFDETKLDDMISENPDEVVSLLSGDNNIGDLMYDRINEFTKASGYIDTKLEGLNNRIDNIEETIQKNQDNFQRRQKALVKKYSMYESTMNSLNGQMDYVSAALSSLDGNKS